MAGLYDEVEAFLAAFKETERKRAELIESLVNSRLTVNCMTDVPDRESSKFTFTLARARRYCPGSSSFKIERLRP